LGWVGASALVHAAFYVALVVGLVPLEEWTAVGPEPIDVEIIPTAVEVAPPPPELPPAPEPEPEAPQPEAPDPAVAPTRVPEPVRTDRAPPSREPAPSAPDAPSAPSSTSPPPSTIDLPEVTPDGRELSDEERRRRAMLVDPAAVARSGFDFGPGPSQRGAPAGLGPRPTGPSEREIESRLASGLRAEAMTKRHLDREPFRLQRRSDGSHVWVGPRLTGIVLPDGRVRFEDRPGVSLDLTNPAGQGTFDLTDAMMGAAGQDPLRAEREYFMRQTEELRARLEAEHRRRQMSEALRVIPGRLTRIWQTTSRTPEERRRRIFQLWDECDESDPSGREARAAMIRWIRLNLPRGSGNEYTEDELRRLNARRESREEFAPY
ncbi:MAG TPA: hypothetical protein VIL20_29090, partial [Sandaracinaceae bacterium]